MRLIWMVEDQPLLFSMDLSSTTHQTPEQWMAWSTMSLGMSQQSFVSLTTGVSLAAVVMALVSQGGVSAMPTGVVPSASSCFVLVRTVQGMVTAAQVPNGCKCNPGYHGDNCSTICPKGSYGYDCRATCRCPGNETACHSVTGQCHCDPGFTGLSCESSCDLGRFGEECKGVCHCKDGCFCHPIDGSCDLQTPSHNHWKEGQCFGDLMIANRRMDLVSPNEMTSWFSAVVILSVITSLSVIVNLYFLYRCCETGSLRRRLRPRPVRQFQHLPRFLSDDDENLSDEKMDDDMRANIPLMNLDANDSPRRSVR